jgi:hypothetical protein
MNPSRFSLTPANHRPLVQLLLPVLVVLVMAVAGATPTTSRPTAFQAPEVRQIKITRKNDHPVAIKQIRNAQSPRFLQDVEIEIQNVSNKPIYYVHLYIRFPDIEVKPKTHYAFSLYYGDPRLEQSGELAGPLDKPLLAGATYTLRVPANVSAGFEGYKAKEHLPPAAINKVEIRVEEVSFGDGTKYEWDRPNSRTGALGKDTPSTSKGQDSARQAAALSDDSHGIRH